MSVPAIGSMPALHLSFGLMVDPLTALMLLIITGVGSLIHWYSTGYMADDKGYARYFTYLNLFVFFMLLLVMGANMLVMFMGWEGVGLASYLLIGYLLRAHVGDQRGQKSVYRQPHRRLRAFWLRCFCCSAISARSTITATRAF